MNAGGNNENGGGWRKRLLSEEHGKGEMLLIQAVYRAMGIPVANYFFTRTNVTANQLTLVSALFGVLSGVLFLQGQHAFIIGGAAALHLSLLLDYADGSLAKLRDEQGVFGDWLDITMDRVVDFCAIAGIIAGVYLDSGQPIALALGVIFIGTRFLIDTTYALTLASYPFLKEKYKETKNSNKKSIVVLRQFIYARTSFLFGAIVFAVFDQLFWYVVLMTAYSILWYFVILLSFFRSIHAFENAKKQ